MTTAQAQQRTFGTRVFALVVLGFVLFSAGWVGQAASLSELTHHATAAAGSFDGLTVEGSDSLRLGSRARKALPPRDGEDSSDGNDGFSDHLPSTSAVAYAFVPPQAVGSSPSLHFVVSQRYRLPLSRAPPRA